MRRALRQTWTIFTHELREYFASPAYYVVAALFHLLAGVFFLQLLDQLAQFVADPYRRSAYKGELNLSQFVLTDLFDMANFLLLFLVPALTMRLFAEEKRLGSFELLVSTPIHDWSILLGKWAACYVSLLALIASAAVYPVMAARFGELEWGLVWSSMTGLALLAGAYVSIGIFTSSLTDNQIIAAVIAFALTLLFVLLGDLAPTRTDRWVDIVRAFSFSHRTRTFYEGMVRGEDVLFLVLFASGFLFATARILEARRWRR